MTALADADAQALLDRVIYERVSDLVDFLGMGCLETVLAMEITDVSGYDDDRARDMARQLIDRAWPRMLADPRRYSGVSPPSCELCDAEEAIHRSGAG